MFQKRPLHDAAIAGAMRKQPCTPQKRKQKRQGLFFHSLPEAIRAAARFISPSRADLAMRGFAISFLTLARVASPNFFLAFFFIEHP